MKKILISMMTIAMVAALIGGGIYAAFSDPETSSSNQFTAGTLDLTVDGENPWASTKISVGSMKPGDACASPSPYICTVANVGNLDGTLTVDLDNLTDNDNTCHEPESSEGDDAVTGELSANLTIVLWHDDGAGGGTANNGIQDGTEATLYNGLLNAEAGPYSVGTLAASGTDYVAISYSIASSVGNVIQSDQCIFDIVFTLNQA